MNYYSTIPERVPNRQATLLWSNAHDKIETYIRNVHITTTQTHRGNCVTIRLLGLICIRYKQLTTKRSRPKSLNQSMSTYTHTHTRSVQTNLLAAVIDGGALACLDLF